MLYKDVLRFCEEYFWISYDLEKFIFCYSRPYEVFTEKRFLEYKDKIDFLVFRFDFNYNSEEHRFFYFPYKSIKDFEKFLKSWDFSDLPKDWEKWYFIDRTENHIFFLHKDYAKNKII